MSSHLLIESGFSVRKAKVKLLDLPYCHHIRADDGWKECIDSCITPKFDIMNTGATEVDALIYENMANDKPPQELLSTCGAYGGVGGLLEYNKVIELRHKGGKVHYFLESHIEEVYPNKKVAAVTTKKPVIVKRLNKDDFLTQITELET